MLSSVLFLIFAIIIRRLFIFFLFLQLTTVLKEQVIITTYCTYYEKIKILLATVIIIWSLVIVSYGQCFL